MSNAVVIAVYVFVMLLFLLTIGSIIWYLYGHRRFRLHSLRHSQNAVISIFSQ